MKTSISDNSGVKISSQGFGKSLGYVRASFPFQVTSEESLKIKFSFCVPFTHNTISLKLRTGFWIWIKSLSVFNVNLNTQIIHVLATTHIGNSYNLNHMCCTFQKKWRTAPQKTVGQQSTVVYRLRWRILATLDVCSLCTNIPQEEGIKIICHHYKENQIYLPLLNSWET